MTVRLGQGRIGCKVETTEEVRGIDAVGTLPRTATITSEEIRYAMLDPLDIASADEISTLVDMPITRVGLEQTLEHLDGGGLVDELGSFEDSVRIAAELAGLAEGEYGQTLIVVHGKDSIIRCIL